MTTINYSSKNKDYCRVVVLGEIGSGKTTLIASVLGAINESEHFFLRGCMSNNQVEKGVFMDLRDAVAGGRFPERDYSIRNSKPSQTVGFEFEELMSKTNQRIELVDLAGHYCRYIGMSNDVRERIKAELGAADLCLIVVDFERAADDTDFIREFLNIYEKCSTPALLVVTKTDKIGAGKMDADALMRKLPLFYSYLPSNYGIGIVPFSVGKVVKTEEGFIVKKFDGSFALNLLGKVQEVMAAKVIPKMSMKQKILNFFKVAAM